MSNDKSLKAINEELLKETMLAIEENIFDVDFVEMLLNNYRQAKLTEKLFQSFQQNEQNDIVFNTDTLENLGKALRM